MTSSDKDPTMTLRRTWQGALIVLTTLALAVAGLVLTPTTNAAAQAPRTGLVTGLVTDADGLGVDSVRVTVRKASQLDDSDVEHTTVTSDGGGYDLKVPAGTWVVTAQPEFGPGTLQRNVRVRADDTYEADLQLPRSVTVTGRYTLAHAWPKDDPQPSVGISLVALDPDAFPRSSEPLGGGDGTWSTNVAAGRYRVRAGGYLYYDQCVGAGQAPTSDPTCARTGTVVDVSAARHTLDPVVLRYRWTKVTGTILGPDGRPLRRAVALDPDGDPADVPRSNGTYSFFFEKKARTTFEPSAADARRGVRPKVKTFTYPGRGNQTVRYDARLRSTSRTTASATGGRRTATVRVRVTPRFTGATRDGRVSVRYKKSNGRAGVRTGTLSRQGRVTVQLPRARKGVRTLTVSYGGGTGMAPSRTKVRVRVR